MIKALELHIDTKWEMLYIKRCKLELHPDKTKIVYCKDDKRKGEYENISFDFLGFTFQLRLAKNSKTGKFFIGFNPAISTKSAKRIRLVMRRWKIQLRSDLSFEDLSERFINIKFSSIHPRLRERGFLEDFLIKKRPKLLRAI